MQQLKTHSKAKCNIGVTEAGDASLDLSWVRKLNNVEGAIVITKHITPEFRKVVLENQRKLIVHATITGYGGTIVEPHVPTVQESKVYVQALADEGFPMEKIVIRVDPIIPTPKGIKTARGVIEEFAQMGFQRFRVSIVDMYPHSRARFQREGLPLPYGTYNFEPSREQIAEVDQMLKQFPSLRIEACAEPGLSVPIHCGCVSEYDMRILGLTMGTADTYGRQRYNCLCYSGKQELLTKKAQCPHGCLYCYWR